MYAEFILFVLFVFLLRAIANSVRCDFPVKWNMKGFEEHSFSIIMMQKDTDFLVTVGKLI